MAKTQEVKVVFCDGCNKPILPSKPNTEPKGFYGTVHEVHPDGNVGPVDFFACNDRCIKNAVLKTLGG